MTITVRCHGCFGRIAVLDGDKVTFRDRRRRVRQRRRGRRVQLGDYWYEWDPTRDRLDGYSCKCEGCGAEHPLSEVIRRARAAANAGRSSVALHRRDDTI